MNPCRPESLDALMYGELPPRRAARVRRHAEGCATCGDELRWLERERTLFEARALAARLPPPFEATATARPLPPLAWLRRRAPVALHHRAPLALGLCAAASAILALRASDPSGTIDEHERRSALIAPPSPVADATLATFDDVGAAICRDEAEPTVLVTSIPIDEPMNASDDASASICGEGPTLAASSLTCSGDVGTSSVDPRDL